MSPNAIRTLAICAIASAATLLYTALFSGPLVEVEELLLLFLWPPSPYAAIAVILLRARCSPRLAKTLLLLSLVCIFVAVPAVASWHIFSMSDPLYGNTIIRFGLLRLPIYQWVLLASAMLVHWIWALWRQCK